MNNNYNLSEKPWLEVHIDTVHAGLEPVEALLSSLGIDGLVIEDEEEFQEFLAEQQQYWDYVDEALETHMQGRSRITFYLESSEMGFAKLGEVRIALAKLKASQKEKNKNKDCDDCDYGSLLMTLENLEESDWANNWRQFYKPMEVGKRLLIIPEWERKSVANFCSQTQGQARVPVILEPGLTFGTGSHATTQLCLIVLERYIHAYSDERVLDLGCGSGILSIAALCLGASEAVAVDIDKQCRHIARENAALNKINPDIYRIEIGDVLTDQALRESLGSGYHLVIANIVADVILALAPMVHRFLQKDGWFLCSGIIEDRKDEVAVALRQNGWDIIESHTSGGWYCYLCRLSNI